MNKELPIYYVSIEEDETLGMEAISLVEHPAIEKSFLKFEKQERLKFKADSDRQMLYGPAILADKPIYRRNGDFEYYITFSRDVIEQIVERYSKNGLWSRINLKHDENAFVEGVNLIEVFIKDSQRGLNPVGFEDCPDGSLFCRFHVENTELWNELKNSEYQGFSIEITCEIVEKMSATDTENEDGTFDKEIESLLNDVKN